jgi:hypothetical protein
VLVEHHKAHQEKETQGQIQHLVQLQPLAVVAVVEVLGQDKQEILEVLVEEVVMLQEQEGLATHRQHHQVKGAQEAQVAHNPALMAVAVAAGRVL